MNRRMKLWREVCQFCDFVETWYPRITEVKIFGSFLWKDSPSDVDVNIKSDKDLRYILNHYQKLFPNIHVNKHRTPKEYAITQTIWKRGQGMIVNEIPPKKEEAINLQMRFFRKQIDDLKKEIKSHSHSSGRYLGYFPY